MTAEESRLEDIRAEHYVEPDEEEDTIICYLHQTCKECRDSHKGCLIRMEKFTNHKGGDFNG